MSNAATARGPLNGVDVPTLFATIDVVKGTPELGKFQFRATNRWDSGTYSKTRIESYFGAGEDHDHAEIFEVGSDHPAVLVGEDRGPLPVELLLAGLASCLTAGIGNIASARGIELQSVESSVTGELDARGVLGLSDEVRNGFEKISIDFRIEADAPREKIEEIVMQSKNRSAVYDALTNGTPVEITVA